MITHLLDTSIYSQRLRRKPLASVVERWCNLGDASLAISAVCESEIRFGLEKKDSPRLWSEYREFLENRLVLLPVDKSVSEVFGKIKARMQKAGTPRDDFDLLIASTAIVHGLVLATLNLRHFEGIEGLEVEGW